MRSAAFTPLQRAQQRFPSPSPPKKGGEGRGEEAVLRHFPLSPALSPLVPHGERGKKPSAFFMPNTILVPNPRYKRLKTRVTTTTRSRHSSWFLGLAGRVNQFATH